MGARASVASLCLLESPSLAAGRGVDLREAGRFGVHWCAAVGHCASDHFPYADAPCAAALFLIPCSG
jgi:hypothetical protein